MINDREDRFPYGPINAVSECHRNFKTKCSTAAARHELPKLDK